MGCENMSAPLSDETYGIVQVSVYTVATGSFAIFGIFSNIVNIVVFYRQGILVSSSIVNLTGLAVSDFFNCAFTVILGVSYVFEHFVSFNYSESTASTIGFIFAARPLEITVQTTCWITAFTAFERVFCVVFPFKVKSIFTPRRSLVVVIAIFVGTFILCIPITFEYWVNFQERPVNNYTFLATSRSSFISPEMVDAYIILNPFVLRFFAIFIVAFCNVILFWKVYLSTKFRKGAAHHNKIMHEKKENVTGDKKLSKKSTKNSDGDDAGIEGQGHSQTKEMKLLKMITVVSIVFTVCYSVFVVFIVLYWLVMEACVDISLQEHTIAWDVSNLFQIVNSSTNIIIYYTMSSRFKEELDKTTTTMMRMMRCKE